MVKVSEVTSDLSSAGSSCSEWPTIYVSSSSFLVVCPHLQWEPERWCSTPWPWIHKPAGGQSRQHIEPVPIKHLRWLIKWNRSNVISIKLHVTEGLPVCRSWCLLAVLWRRSCRSTSRWEPWTERPQLHSSPLPQAHWLASSSQESDTASYLL